MPAKAKKTALGTRTAGRPPLPPEERRSVKASNLWTPAEAEMIAEAMEELDVDYNELTRPIILERVREILRSAAVRKKAGK